jgi:hypothetical protein
MEALMDVSLETMEVCLEKMEASEGKVEIRMEVCMEEMKLETIGALEDRYGDRHLAVRHHGRPK